MTIKSYFAASVEDAMAAARAELGPEAMLVNSRRSVPETRHLGEYEVVFASDFPAPESAAQVSANPILPPAPDRLSVEVAELKKELEGMRRVLTRSAFASPQWSGASPSAADAYAALSAAEVNPEVAREVVEAAEARAAAARPTLSRVAQRLDATVFQRALVEEFESRCAVDPTLGKGDASPRITALVGPPGCGKTTTLVKIAVNYGLAARRPVLLLSVDNYRVAAAEQLRSYAAILGVGFQLVETVAALAQAIEENRGKELILIDTPGFGFGDLDEAATLAQFLSSREDIDTQLVLPASVKGADLARMSDAFQAFRPGRLMFTRLDETASFGAILNESVRTGKPISFFTAGQRIPEDLETATRARLTELILTGAAGRVRPAA